MIACPRYWLGAALGFASGVFVGIAIAQSMQPPERELPYAPSFTDKGPYAHGYIAGYITYDITSADIVIFQPCYGPSMPVARSSLEPATWTCNDEPHRPGSPQ